MDAGAAWWLVFCLAAVAVRGVRWDETYEHAQILLGHIPYPAEHPLRQYLAGAYSGQLYLGVLTLAAGAGEYVFNFVRNAFFLMAAVLPAYLLTEAATGRRAIAHGAAALTLAGLLNAFNGSYPMGVWPNIFSNGLIGGGAVLLCVWAMATGRTFLAAALAAAMPAIHIGQIPALGLAWLVTALWDVRTDRSRARTIAAGLACGLTLSILTAAAMRGFAEPAGMESDASAEAIWQAYTFRFDEHRRAMPATGWQSMGLAAAMGVCAAPLAWRTRNRALGVLLGFMAATFAAILSAWAIRLVLGENTPFWAIGWMPYRLVNHLPYIALALIAALLAQAPGNRGVWLVAGALAFMTLRGFLYPVAPDLFSRYLQAPGFLFHVLCGVAAGLTAAGDRPARVGGIAAAAMAVAIPLAVGQQYGAACGLLGVAAGAALRIRPRLVSPAAPWAGRACAGAAAVLTLALLLGQWRDREPLRNADELALRDYLARHAAPGDIVAAEPYAFLLQAKLGRPIFTETATASLMSYVPRLASRIDRMFRDVYGFSFVPGAPSRGPWEDVWRARSAAEWIALRDAYGIVYLLTPPDLELHLDTAFESESAVVYAIPPPP